jgi:excisionase family DNA binding protein
MAGVREKLLTASDLATLCEVDLKTIHNWVDRGRIAHFRTPGRHLRFRAADVADFLRAWGYAVPRDLARAGSRTILALGTKDTVGLLQRALGEASVASPAFGGVSLQPRPNPSGAEPSTARHPIQLATHPYDALIFAGADPADVYVVDVPALTGDTDVNAVIAALHRGSPQSKFIIMVGEARAPLPFASNVHRDDSTSLRALLLPEANAAPGGASTLASMKQQSAQIGPTAQLVPGTALGRTSTNGLGTSQAANEDAEQAPLRSLVASASR